MKTFYLKEKFKYRGRYTLENHVFLKKNSKRLTSTAKKIGNDTVILRKIEKKLRFL